LDTLSHMLLGAALGNAALGRRVGNKAMLWGAAVAVVPDVDVAIGRFMSDLGELTFHRGPTHSLLFIAVLAPLIGLALGRVHRRDGVGWQPWAALSALVLLSHVLLDAFTSYGVQLFLPFDDTALALASVSVIDPVFTLPLLLAVPAMFLLGRDRRLRYRIGGGAMALSVAYLGFTVSNKLHVQSVFEQALLAQELEAERMFVKPTLFNNVLWRAVVETPEAYWVGFHSRLDAPGPIRFQRFEKNHRLLAGLENEPAVQRLAWVSNGYFKAERRGEDVYIHDLRYGQAFEWMQTERDFVFSYRLVPPVGEGDYSIETIPPRMDRDRDGASARELVERIRGNVR
jgi:inner membrane protein